MRCYRLYEKYLLYVSVGFSTVLEGFGCVVLWFVTE